MGGLGAVSDWAWTAEVRVRQVASNAKRKMATDMRAIPFCGRAGRRRAVDDLKWDCARFGILRQLH